jgi:hypothetical protein
MDISLKGKLNGIETAELIDSELETPIIYYSSNSDDELSEKIKQTQNRDYVPKTSADEKLKLSIERNIKKKSGNPDETELSADNITKSELVKLEKSITTTKGDETVNKSIKVSKKECYQNKDRNQLKHSIKNMEDMTEDHENEKTVTATTSKNVNERINDEYSQTHQIIEHELNNLETNFTEVFEKSVSQEKEIIHLNKLVEEYKKLLFDRETKLEELMVDQKKLEEQVINYKDQYQNVLNEIYDLKNRINTFIGNLK